MSGPLDTDPPAPTRTTGAGAHRRSAQAEAEADSRLGRLQQAGVDTVLVAVVDPAGVTRAKVIPAAKLADATRSGIGFSRALTVFCVYDLPAALPGLEAPIGDLRLIPDLASAVPLAAQPGVAWAVADQYDEDAREWPGCPRLFLKRMTSRLEQAGLTLRVGYELEWFQGRRTEAGAGCVPGHPGPGYSAIAFTSSDAPVALLRALYQQEVPVEQFHPELAPGQYELSTAPLPPVAAADTNLLVRQTIRGVARGHGEEASFSPVPVLGGIGNGNHVHVSLWDDAGRNLFADGLEATGGSGDAATAGTGETARTGAAFLAGVLRELPALVAVTSPSPLSYQRLRPQMWAGAYQAWGRENREVALRFVPGTAGFRSDRANVEYKPIDHAANPHLALGALIAAGLAGVEEGLDLPAGVPVDPATLSDAERDEAGIRRLPASLAEAAEALEGSSVLTAAMGELLASSFLATRRAELAHYRSASDAELVTALRWRY